MKSLILFITAFIISLTVFSADLTSFFKESDAFFKKYVADGKVAYDEIKNSPNQLNELVNIIKDISIDEKDVNSYKAFWINAYNISVINGIVANYPTKSPLNITGFFDVKKYLIAGKQVTLNDIENTILRAKFKDARFHFVLVCGAISCPPIINEAYLPSKIEQQLDKQTRLALNGNSFIRIDEKKKLVVGSEILKWYKEDFNQNGKTEIDFINQYRTKKIPTDFKLTYYTYDWNLNKQ
jgi:hypothetical protein